MVLSHAVTWFTFNTHSLVILGTYSEKPERNILLPKFQQPLNT